MSLLATIIRTIKIYLKIWVK